MNIDPNVLNVILGVVANGATAVIAGSYNKFKGTPKSKAEEPLKGELPTHIRKEIEKVSDTIQFEEPPRIEELCLFITSPDVNAVVRQLYTARLFAEQRKTIDDIQEEFHRLFAYHFGFTYDESTDKADTLFNALSIAVEKGLDIAIAHNLLPAHEAKSARRFQILHNELLTLRKNIQFLTSQPLDIDAVRRFVQRYREQIADRHGRITPPNYDDARKLPIDSIYVTPNFIAPNIWVSIPTHFTVPDRAWSSIIDKALTKKIASKFEFTDETLSSIISWTPSKLDTELISEIKTQPVALSSIRNYLVHGTAFKEETLIDLEELLSRVNRTVILGNPGGGKSTFTNKICFDFTKYSTTGNRDDELNRITPIPVILREYGNEKKIHNYSILQFIEATASNRYQVTPPSGAFEYLLLNGQAAVIFDGLDELLETGYRQEIRDDIESFCNLYPSVPVIVTSREVGYEQAPLDPEKFTTYRLAPFNEEQVNEYVGKWFNTRSEYTIAQRQQKTRDFLRESQIVFDLRSNPLMLGLMCNIYRGENYIPKNRPDVYRKCAEMLFERWDRSREIPITFHFEDDIRPAMAFLAHWIYEDTKLQEGVTERALINKAATYLLEHRYENRDRAERAAREFIEFCRGRAWVFTDAGADKEGEGLYQFTHRTFLEYFTAVYLVRTHETTEELVQTLLPRICKREWDIVAQLAFQIKNRSSEGAKDKLLSSLLARESELSEIEAWSILSFVARCLEFMEPSPKVTRDITKAFIKGCLALRRQLKINYKTGKVIGNLGPTYDLLDEAFLALITASEQNREIVAESFKENIVEEVKRDSREDGLTALELGLHLTWPIESGATREEKPQSLIQFWSGISGDIIKEVKEYIVAQSSIDLPLSVYAYNKRLVPIKEIIKRFGIGGLFQPTQFVILKDIRQEPISITLIRDCLYAIYSGNSSSNDRCNDLAEIGRLALSIPLPCVSVKRGREMYPNTTLIIENNEIQKQSDNSDIDPDILFGIFTVFAVWIELYIDEALKKARKPPKHRNQRKTKKYIEYSSIGKRLYQSMLGQGINADTFLSLIYKSKIAIFKNLKPILLSRFGVIKQAEVDNSISNCRFTPEQEQFVRRWSNQQIGLAKSTG
jgi:hypothetical protein